MKCTMHNAQCTRTPGQHTSVRDILRRASHLGTPYADLRVRFSDVLPQRACRHNTRHRQGSRWPCVHCASSIVHYERALRRQLAAPLGLRRDARERGRRGHGEIGKRLPVEADAGDLEAVDQLSVGQPVLAGRGVDPDYLRRRKPLLVRRPTKVVLEGGVGGLFGCAIQLALRRVEAFGACEELFLRLARWTVPRLTEGTLFFPC